MCVCVGRCGRGGNNGMVGAEFLAAAAGGAGCGYYFEVEVLDVQGWLCVGFAGTNLGPQCAQVGDDACSWGYYMGDGDGRHGCVGSATRQHLSGVVWLCRRLRGDVGAAGQQPALIFYAYEKYGNRFIFAPDPSVPHFIV